MYHIPFETIMKSISLQCDLLRLKTGLRLSFGCLILVGAFNPVFPSLSWGGTDILDVELAHEIQEREPAASYQPRAYCEKDRQRNVRLTRIHTSDQQVVFWNRVASTDSTMIRHAWHKKFEEGWKPMANVDLPIQKSSAFRIWSTKDLHPTLHRGEWMIVVSMVDDPKQVLCIARFIVE